jgi:hypothetical protein
MTISAVRFHDGERYCCAIARVGKTKLHLTFIDDCGVRHTAVPREHERYTTPLTLGGKEYPLSRMVRRFRAVGRASEITEAAKHELTLAQETSP